MSHKVSAAAAAVAVALFLFPAIERSAHADEAASGAEAAPLNTSLPNADWHQRLRSKEITLESIREIFDGQEVVVGGVVGSDDKMLAWRFAKKRGDAYTADMSKQLPGKYRGLKAKVVAVQAHASQFADEPNALGEVVNHEQGQDPYFDIVVRFENGKMGITSSSAGPLSLSSDIELLALRHQMIANMEHDLPGIIGREVFATGLSRLYQIDASLKDLADEPGSAGILKQLSPADVPFLEPLEILAAKYVETHNAVILKVKLPDGREALSYAGGVYLFDDKESFLERVSGSLMAEIPTDFTPDELNAIRSKTFARGMDGHLVMFILGLPTDENDYGRAGKQLIYGSSLYVYLDERGMVTDWQSF